MDEPAALLIEPERMLAGDAPDGALAVHVGDARGYADAHLPGAALVTPRMLQRGVPPAIGELPGSEALSALGTSLRLAESPFLVVYDDEGGAWAGRLIWTLDVLSYPRCAYLDGGLHAWRAAGGPLRSGPPPEPAPAPAYRAALNDAPLIAREELLARLGDPGLAIWDARTAEEYRGTRALAARGGHIPGALHCEWLECVDRERDFRLRGLETARARLSGIGLDAAEVVTHCHTHHRSGLTYLVGRLLGWRIRAYPGSWADWGNREDTPVATGPEPGDWPRR